MGEHAASGPLYAEICFRELLSAADRLGRDEASAGHQSISDLLRGRHLASVAERKLQHRGSEVIIAANSSGSMEAR